MTIKHTPEPWPFFVDWAEPSTPHPESEPIVRLGYDNYQRARYCVNACQGVSNGQLALTSVSGAILMLKEVEQQRDELLEALEEVHRIASGSNITHNMMVIRDHCADAIAKAKGGAA